MEAEAGAATAGGVCTITDGYYAEPPSHRGRLRGLQSGEELADVASALREADRELAAQLTHFERDVFRSCTQLDALSARVEPRTEAEDPEQRYRD